MNQSYPGMQHLARVMQQDIKHKAILISTTMNKKRSVELASITKSFRNNITWTADNRWRKQWKWTFPSNVRNTRELQAFITINSISLIEPITTKNMYNGIYNQVVVVDVIKIDSQNSKSNLNGFFLPLAKREQTNTRTKSQNPINKYTIKRAKW